MTILGAESQREICPRACFCLRSLNTLFKGTRHVKVIEMTQTHPMANKWGQGMGGDCGFSVVTDLDKTNTGFTTIISQYMILGQGGVVMSKNKKTAVKIYLLFSVMLQMLPESH